MSSTYISLSPSILEEFRLLISGAYERMGKGSDDFVRYIMSEYQPNIYTSRGNAYGDVLEKGLGIGAWVYSRKAIAEMQEEFYEFEEQQKEWRDHAPDLIRPDLLRVHEKSLNKNWYFTSKELAPAIALRQQYPQMIYEKWGGFSLKILDQPVYISLRADGLNGNQIHEFKTSTKPKSRKDRIDSLQRKCYHACWPDSEVLIYHEFQFKGPKEDPFVKYRSHEFQNYKEAKQEVEHFAHELLQWMEYHPECVEKRTRVSKKNG